MNKFKLLLVFLYASFSSVMWAQMNGSGTEDDPYQICNADDLFDVSMNLSAHYVLMNDIDLTEWIEEESPNYGWNPISTFTGSFDGNGKTIRGLTINRTNNSNVGLFGSVSNATLKNIAIDSPQINGGSCVGSLAGSVTGTTVDNITIITPSVSGTSIIGGLIGSFRGTISNINIIRPVIQCSGSSVGGMIGKLSSNISSITITEPHVSGQSYVGGVAGHAYEDASEITVINPVIIATNDVVGGIIGYWEAESSNATIRNKSLSQNYIIGGTIQGNNKVGGIVGEGYRSVKSVVSYNYSYSLIRNYSSATVIGNNAVGGICGYIRSSSWRKKSENAGKNIDEIANFLYNRNDGNVSGNQNIGGICGYVFTELDDTGNSTVTHAGSYTQNVVTGNVFGTKNTNGMFGFFSITASNGGSVPISKNLNTSSLISATSAAPTRIGCSGTNYALNSTVLMQGSQQLEVEDGGNNGTGYGLRTLKRKNTYIGFGYDFDNTWAIVDGKSFPYNIYQSTPPNIEMCTSGLESNISGTAIGDGKVYVFVGDRMIEGVVTDGTWNVALGEVSPGASVIVSVETQGMKPSVIVSTIAAAEDVPVTISSAGYATFHNPGGDLNIPEGVTAYTVTVNNGSALLNEINGKIPANTPVVLKGAAGTYYFSYTTGATPVGENHLRVSAGSLTADGTQYALTKKSGVVGFNKIKVGTAIPEGKVYLQVPSAGIKEFFALESDDATGIENLNVKANLNDVIYNVAGQRLQKMQRGINIVNGKKVMVK